jgi:hypothetical protein
MRQTLIAACLFVAAAQISSCIQKPMPTAEINAHASEGQSMRDSIQTIVLNADMGDTVYIESSNKMDSMARQIDTLRTQLYLSNQKIERVKHHAAIVQHNKSQLKFFLGWVTRDIR